MPKIDFDEPACDPPPGDAPQSSHLDSSVFLVTHMAACSLVSGRRLAEADARMRIRRAVNEALVGKAQWVWVADEPGPGESVESRPYPPEMISLAGLYRLALYSLRVNRASLVAQESFLATVDKCLDTVFAQDSREGEPAPR